MGGDRQDKCRATPSLPTGKVWRFDIVCALDVVSSYECRLCVTFPIKPLMLRCPSSAAVQLWPLLLRKGPAPRAADGVAVAVLVVEGLAGLPVCCWSVCVKASAVVPGSRSAEDPHAIDGGVTND